MENLPVQYHLEIYEDSFCNDPSFSCATSDPFLQFSEGDIFDYRSMSDWYNPPQVGECFQIHKIKHILWKIDQSHIGHKVMLCLKIVKEKE